MTKLIIQIPCYNEEETLGIALAALPRELPGVDVVEWLVIDDGSQDRTIEVARNFGVDHILELKINGGLARAYMAGLHHSLSLGADIIINTDADNQYNAEDIPKLTAPILAGEADIVVGARPIDSIEHFSLVKKCLQRIGSWVVRQVSGTDIPDAPSGFRAVSRQAAMQLNVFNSYTYTLETIIQAGQKNIAITSVPVRVNENLRPSRLVKSIASYVQRSMLTMIRIFLVYRPMRFFATLGSIVFALGALVGVRFMVYFTMSQGHGHIQSLLLAVMLMLIGCMLLIVGVLADLIAVNRKLLEQTKIQLYRIEGMMKQAQSTRELL